MSHGNLLYAQSGGVTAVINATASAVIHTARSHRVKVLAARNGILGALREDLIDTSQESAAAIRALARWGVVGHRVSGAPGIYVRLDDPFSHAVLAQRPQQRPPGTPAPPPDFTGLGKIAALGIKVTRHHTYHGLALNVAMDLTAFERINPCGYPGLRTVDLRSLGVAAAWDEAARELAGQLQRLLAV